MVRTPLDLAIGVAVLCALAAPGAAVVSSDGNTACRNSSASACHVSAAGLTAEEIALWDQLGTLNGFYVTPVSARHVLAAGHIGGSVGNTVTFGPGPNQGTYTTTGFVDDPDADLRLWELDGLLASWLPIYTGASEVDSITTIFGRGAEPGPAVTVDPAGALGPPPADLKGWEWGSRDGLGSWGRNVVDRIAFVAASGLAIAIDLDRPVFGGLDEECHLSSGDSSGPWFVEEAGVWYLAGVSSLVSGPFQHDAGGTPDGQPFEAMLFDKGGLWENEPAFFNSEQFTDKPSSAFAVRISSRQDWLLPLLDSDGDGIPDESDICPHASDPQQLDTGGVGTSTPDGIGDACQCGDVTGDGIVSGTDSIFITRQALGLVSPLFLVPGNCDVTGDGLCNGIDSIFITRAALGLSAPLFGQNCPNATP